jgi:GNAT superfamily N-acetyltransferase
MTSSASLAIAPLRPAAPSRRRRVDIGSGRAVTLRAVESSDAAALEELYAGLSAESLRRRFLAAGVRCARVIADLAAADGVVAELAERGPADGMIVGHASLHPAGIGCAEAAFVVADAYQDHGIGHALVASAIERARHGGVERLNAELLLENVPMRHLLRSTGWPVISDEAAEGSERITLAIADRREPSRAPRRWPRRTNRGWQARSARPPSPRGRSCPRRHRRRR